MESRFVFSFLQKKLENEKHKQSQSNYERDIAKLSSIYDTMQHEECLIMKELSDLTYKGARPPVKLPPIKKEIKGKTKLKQKPSDRRTELKNATMKIKEILETLDVCSPDIAIYNALVDDLKELYGLNINDTVDDVVDVLIDLTNKKEESTIGVSNHEVIKATLSMLLLDIEQSETQLDKHEADDVMSVQSDVQSDEDKTDIIKVSLQPDDGDGNDRLDEAEELFTIENANESDTESNKDEIERADDLGEDNVNLKDNDIEESTENAENMGDD